MSFGELALRYCHVKRPIQVCKSAAGYYIGTLDEDGTPMSRESVEYFRSKEDAETALTNGTWEQKQTP